MKKVLHIGFDDTDSLKGSCTTHLATLIISRIFDQVSFLDFPNLIRLNPNIPYKTRGNGAVSLTIEGEVKDLEFCKELTIKAIKKFSRVNEENTNPGLIFLTGDIQSSVKQFSNRAMWDVLTIPDAEKFELEPNIEILKFGNGRGIIGGLSAIGNPLETDFTYEHLSYRSPKKYGTKRLIDEESIYQADKNTQDTFNNIDYEYNAIMITPRGADPVFSGIRGETFEGVSSAWDLLKPLEEIEMLMVFRTNQHTNQHLVRKINIADAKPYRSVSIDAIVSKAPHYIEGSHLIFSIRDETGEIDCAAYEPTKRFRGQLNSLTINDEIRVYGGLRPAEENHPMTLNIERLDILALVPKTKKENPFCDECGSRLKSAGKNKGYKCFKCSAVYRNKKPNFTPVERKLKPGIYLPPIIAHRHLTRPMTRLNRDNTGLSKQYSEINNLLQNLVNYNKLHSSILNF